MINLVNVCIAVTPLPLDQADAVIRPEVDDCARPAVDWPSNGVLCHQARFEHDGGDRDRGGAHGEKRAGSHINLPEMLRHRPIEPPELCV